MFFSRLKARYNAYRETTELDYPEIEFWQQVMLPDLEPEFVAAHAQAFTTFWRDTVNGRRVIRAGTVETVKELHRRGYQLGIIANTITEAEIPDWMVAEGISHCFTTILSSKVRLRMPDPTIYHLACRCCGTPEADCAYVGDNPERDAEGTRAAGFGCMIRIDDLKNTIPNRCARASDHLIRDLKDLLELFPDRTIERND